MTFELSKIIREKLREFLKEEEHSKEFLKDLVYYLSSNTSDDLLEKNVFDTFSVNNNNKYKVTVYNNTYTSTLVLTSIILNTINLFIIEHIEELELADVLKASDLCTNKHICKVFHIEYNEYGKFIFTI